MKRIIIPVLLLLIGVSACKKEDVFALWRDQSKLVVHGESTTFFTMMHYNIWGAHHANNYWNAKQFDRVAAVINSQKPDFCTLSEVDSVTNRNHKYFMAKELAERTGMYYAYAPAIKMTPGSYGDAILSKYPILAVRRFKLYPDPAQGKAEAEDRAVCAIRVEVGGASVWIASAHLDHRENEMSRVKQAKDLKPIIQGLEGSLILGGDLNAKPNSETMRTIFEYMNPQYPSSTEEYYTWPSCYDGAEKPTKLIDYILMKKDENKLDCVSYRVVNEAASDHCAVVATFRVKL